MSQRGQLIQLKSTGRDGEVTWAFRYRVGGRDPKRVQRGGFASERDAAEALDRELERLLREQRVSRSLTLAELVEAYLEQHDVDPVTIDKLRWLLGKAVAVFGERRVGDLRAEEIAAWRIALSPGYRFDATQALRRCCLVRRHVSARRPRRGAASGRVLLRRSPSAPVGALDGAREFDT
jgi:hypothetical protein